MKSTLIKTYRLSMLLAAAVVLLAACHSRHAFSAQERAIILQPDSLMQVMVVPQDSAILRAVATDFTPAELASPLLGTLLDKMLYTVQHPSQDGVGIAAPQVGISRRAICVQRFDKPGEPFEAYLNIHIDSLIGDPVIGPEGCLSVPGLRGMVPRAPRIVISYVSPGAAGHVSETVEGFTAVIFQHECDHLDGILYTDRAVEVFSTGD